MNQLGLLEYESDKVYGHTQFDLDFELSLEYARNDNNRTIEAHKINSIRPLNTFGFRHYFHLDSDIRLMRGG